LPNWVVALVAAGALAAALSTAAGLLLVISTSVAHDLMKRSFMPDISEKQELLYARMAIFIAVLVAGYVGINPPAYVAQVVAYAFGLAAASFFPAIVLGIFQKSMNKQGAIAGMIAGFLFTAGYIIYFKSLNPAMDNAQGWLLGISPEGIGTFGTLINLAVAGLVASFTPEPPEDVQAIVEEIRLPGEAIKR
jgi:cation/acetate symporter